MARRQVSYSQIAEEVGVSQSTVSRALNHHPRISKATRQKVMRAAKKLGYEPDPELGKLMTHLRQMRETRFQAVVGLLEPPGGPRSDYAEILHKSAEERCKELGYIPNTIPYEPTRSGISTCNRVLKARNVEGAIILPRNRDDEAIPRLQVNSMALVSTTVFKDPFPGHQVHADHFANMRLLFAQYPDAKRPSLVSWEGLNKRQRYAPVMTLLHIQQQRGLKDPVPAYEWRGEPEEIEQNFSEWFHRYQPDMMAIPSEVILDAMHDIVGKKALQDVRMAAFGSPSEGLPGLDQRPDLIGRAAVDMLTSHIQRSEWGWPEVGKHMLLPGRWVEM